MGIANKIAKAMEGSSWIRAMFEEGERLRSIYGAENVFDFTLGNPVAEPPAALKEELVRIVTADTKGIHRYMSNSGYETVRQQIADFLTENKGVPFTKDLIIMTVGAAGGINVALKALLDPGDEVIVLNPYFVEYTFYIENHGGVMKLVETKEDFHLDIEAVEAAITPRTKAIIVNSPNNPTGVVYREDELRRLAGLLGTKGALGQTIYLISDEPYGKIVYDSIVLPNLFTLYKNTISITSHSKDLALPGERIGYISVSPGAEDGNRLTDAMNFTNRILGFVNAPALMQRLVGGFQRASVDLDDYREKRDALYGILVEAGFDAVKPEGAFYIFPKSPIPDDVEFVRQLQQHRVLAVPGVGFGRKGHFRLAYCIEMDTIRRSRDAFMKAGELYGLRKR
ncbi:MAG TPA: pyridoxal phosphate-dependent aminotransferase [Deltaproteobacteria bacterium]|nr:pyridoxal phosphate-dependent aminotransferase [Deltaproteobacteria bacterium]